MMKTLLLLLTILMAASVALAAPNAVTCEIVTAYYDSTATKLVPLSTDTATFYLGIPRSGFPVAFAVEIEMTAADSLRAEFTAQVTTTGAAPQTVSKRFAVEYGLPAEIRGINAKTGQDYRLRVVPIEAIREAPEPCTFDHTTGGLFKIFPAASMDIHYLPGSLAEYHQTLIRDVLQTRFMQFRTAFGLSLPGKYSVFACPCGLPSVLWDDRFAMAQDPTRSLMFVIHATDFTSVDPFIVNHTALLRHFGYTPPFLSEGLAGYFGLAVHDMRQLIADGSRIPLADLMPTGSYMAAEPMTADRSAATFVRFLIDSYGWDRFRGLYDRAHDGNLLAQIHETYDLNIDQLQQQWLTWVDTVTILPGQAHVAAEQAEVLRQYGLMSEYFELMLSLTTSPRDSTLALAGMSRAAYYDGDYYQAIDFQQQQAHRDSSAVGNFTSLAGYQMMAGEYESAAQTIEIVLDMAPGNNFALFNKALYYANTGDSVQARKVLHELVSTTESAPSPEASIVMAAFSEPGDDITTMLSEARAQLHRRISTNAAEASGYLWLAWLNILEARHSSTGGSQLQAAEELLQVAHLLESRAFYLGMLYLLQGKLADLRQDREEARDWYGRVLSNPSAAYHQQEAGALLETAYGVAP